MDHRLKNIEEFHALRERLRASQDPTVPTLVIPAGTCGQASGANDLIRVAKRELLSRKLADEIRLRITGCHGFCETEPCVVVEPRGTYYPRVGPGEMERIIRALSRGEICEELLYVDPDSGERIERKQEIPFFRRQGRTLLSRGERIDPIRIYHYILNGGYSADLSSGQSLGFYQYYRAAASLSYQFTSRMSAGVLGSVGRYDYSEQGYKTWIWRTEASFSYQILRWLTTSLLVYHQEDDPDQSAGGYRENRAMIRLSAVYW